MKRANPHQLHDIFDKYASVEKNGERFMTADDFVIKYLNIIDAKNSNLDTVQLLAAIVDTSKDGLISYSEFQAFEGLLCFPDALYKTAFQLFDTNGNGMVSFRKFIKMSPCQRSNYIMYVYFHRGIRGGDAKNGSPSTDTLRYGLAVY